VAQRVGQGRADRVAAGRADPEKSVDDHPVRVGAPRLGAPGVDLLARPAHVAGAGQLGQDRAVGEAARQPQRPWPAHARQDRRRAAGLVVQAHLVQVDVGAVRSDRLTGQQGADGADRLAERGELRGWQGATWCIHAATPCPSPGTARPGNRRASVASSIAVAAGLRSTAGRMPSPTVIRSVAARAVAAEAMPPA
jgi:hypothetical protein